MTHFNASDAHALLRTVRDLASAIEKGEGLYLWTGLPEEATTTDHPSEKGDKM